MDIKKYVELCTKIHADQSSDNVEWSALPKNKNSNLSYKNKLPYHLQMAKELYEPSGKQNLEEKEPEKDEDKATNLIFQFAEIRSSVREIGLGWNMLKGFEKRYKESRQKCIEKIADNSISESDLSYTTASSFTNESYSTAIEDFQHWRRPSVDIKSESSIDSSIDRNRYKKNALITGLIRCAESDFSDEDVVFTECSTDQFATSNLLSDNLARKDGQIESKCEKEMYEDRVSRLFESKEDIDFHCLSKKENEFTESQNAEDDFSNDNVVFTDCTNDQLDSPNSLTDINKEKDNHFESKNEEKWDNNMTESEMYKDRILRLCQSKEEEGVFVHPLREQIQEDPVWQEYRLSRKGIEYTQTARQYYLNLPDDQFEIFEKVEEKKTPKQKRRGRRNRYLL